MRTSWMLALAAFVGLGSASSSVSGCSASSDQAPVVTSDAGVDAPDASDLCANGFQLLSEAAGCGPILPAASCPAGTRAAIGSATCEPVGVTACAAGFAKDPSGWGCDAVLSPLACASGSGTRERLGSTTCAPVSDCNAAFPPAGATLFVDAALDDTLVDATHFKTISAAVAAAPAGAIIAIESGTYSEDVKLAKRKVSLVGRCAEKVVMQQNAGVIGSAIEANAGDDVAIRNFTLRGYDAAISALGGAATIDSVIIEDGLVSGVVAANQGTSVSLTNVVVRGLKGRTAGGQTFGAFASAGATMTVTDSVFAGNEFVNVGASDEGTTFSLSRSIARDGKPNGAASLYGIGVYIAQGATATIEETAVLDNSCDGINVFSSTSANTSATVRRSVIRRTKRDGQKNARGFESTSSKVVIEQTTIGNSAERELIVTAGATLDLSDSTLLGAPPAVPTERGGLGLIVDSSTAKVHSLAIVSPRAGVIVQGTGKVTMDASLVQEPLTAPVYYEDGQWIGLGAFVESHATLTLSSSTIDKAKTMGLLVAGHASLTSTLVRGTRPGGSTEGGRGLAVQNGGVVAVAESAFVDNAEAGVIVQSGNGSLSMSGSTVMDTSVDSTGSYGMGLLFGDDVNADVDSCTITNSKGIGVAVSNAGAFVHHTTISRNAVGVHAQGGTSLVQGEAPGDARSFVVSSDTRFIDNQTRIGSGSVPLPTVLNAK